MNHVSGQRLSCQQNNKYFFFLCDLVGLKKNLFGPDVVFLLQSLKVVTREEPYCQFGVQFLRQNINDLGPH